MVAELYGQDAQTGEKYEFDAAKVSEFTLTLLADDTRGKTSSAQMKIKIVDTNDHVPVFTKSAYATTMSQGTKTGRVVARVVAVDADKDETSKAVTYFQVADPADARFSIDKETGIDRSIEDFNIPSEKEVINLVRAFNEIKDLHSRKKITELIQAIS